MSHSFCTCLPRRPPSASFVLGHLGKQTPNECRESLCLGRGRGSFTAASFPPGPFFLCWHRYVRTRTLCLQKTCGPLRPTEVSSLARWLRGLDVRLVLRFPSFPWDSCLVGVSPWGHGTGAVICAVTEVSWLSFVSYSILLAFIYLFIFLKWVVKMLLIFKLR